MTDPRRQQSVASRIALNITRLQEIHDDLEQLHDRCFANIQPNHKLLIRTLSAVNRAIHQAKRLEGEHLAALRTDRNVSPDWTFEQTLPTT